jgi:putative transposase
VRVGAHVVSKAVVIAYGVHDTGRREVIGLDVGEIESEAFWREFLRSLKRRGLDGGGCQSFRVSALSSVGGWSGRVKA